MTLGEAVEILTSPGWACACSGGPTPYGPCWCQLTIREARALQRGAHIAAKLIADHAAREAKR